MNAVSQKALVPLSYWVIAVISLIWNAFGAYDYVMSRLRKAAYLDAATGGKSEAMLQWMDSLPWYVQIAWPLGVWGSVAGSLLLLARSRHAVTAFVVSLVAACFSFVAERIAGIPADLDSGGAKAVQAVIVVVIALLWFHSRRAAFLGLLR